uniref:Uncharacterized protein n=1 Tax=Heterorhabditis bacteriophora TaxID=37862 RepID=A0A1I7XL93_HETBA
MLCELILLMSIESYANPSVLLFSPINKDTFSYSGTEYFAYIYDGLKDNICELKEANCSLKDTGKHSSTHKATFITEYRSSEILPAEASNFDNQRITGQIQIDWKNQRTRERQWTKSWTKPQLGSFLPNIFAQAAMISTKGENIHDGQNEIIDNAKESKHQKPRGKNQITLEKFICKYRKSCYETGKIPKIQNLSFFSGYWFTPTSQSKENNNERRTNDDTYNNAMASKIKCKYRLSCYMHTKLPTEKNDEQRTLLMAERTMKRLKAAEEKAASRPIPKSIKIEKKINAVGEILNRKLLCKYRKSCYKTVIA